MSTEIPFDAALPEGVPELTTLGKRLEILRIERGISKQFLARHAGTSRQQLWRVMTGKSELTSSLRARLASALAVDTATLVQSVASSASPESEAALVAQALQAARAASRVGLAEYLTDAQ